MKLVCFDTQVIIWGIKGAATPGQENMIAKAKALIAKCEEQTVRIIVPSLVVAELLMALEPRIHNDFISFMNQHFIVPTFDLKAAAVFASLWRDRQSVLGKLDLKIDKTRAEMKADFMIVAVAIAQGADCIYTEDSLLEKFAQNRISVRSIPATREQLSLDLDNDIQ